MPQATITVPFAALSLFLRYSLSCLTSKQAITMNSFLIPMILLLSFLVLLLAWFAISSCLGDEIRAQWSGRATRYVPTTFGLQYARMMGHGGNQAGWEQIEMEDMLDKSDEHRR